MKKLKPSGALFREVGTDDAWSAAQVPGSVHTDLLALGRIPDPFVADNELQVQWVAERDWAYQVAFDVDDALLAEDRLYSVWIRWLTWPLTRPIWVIPTTCFASIVGMSRIKL